MNQLDSILCDPNGHKTYKQGWQDAEAMHREEGYTGTLWRAWTQISMRLAPDYSRGFRAYIVQQEL